jgi:hypothetical protein
MVFLTGGPAAGTLLRRGALLGFGTAGGDSSLPTAAATAAAFTLLPRPLLFGAAPAPLPSFRGRLGMASSGAGPVVYMIGAALGRAPLGCIGLALGLARALDGLAGAADGAAVSSIWSSPAMVGFGAAGATCGISGAAGATGAAEGRAFALARTGALLVRWRLGAEYCTIAAGALGAGSGAGAGRAGGAGGGGGGGRGGMGASSYGVCLVRARPLRIAPAPGAGGGGGPELTTCMSSGSFGGVAIEKWMWLCVCWCVAA